MKEDKAKSGILCSEIQQMFKGVLHKPSNANHAGYLDLA